MKNAYLLIASIAFICGVLIASFGIFENTPFYVPTISVIILFLLLIFSLKRDLLFGIFFLLLIFLLGVLRYGAFNKIEKNHIKRFTPYLEEKVLLKGEIVTDPEAPARPAYKKTFVLEAVSVKLQGTWKKTNGLVLVNARDKKIAPYEYGDIMVLEGFLRRPLSYKTQRNFNYRRYLKNKRIYSILNVKKGFFFKKIGHDENYKARLIRTIYSVRTKIDRHIKKYLASPYDSILAAILLGKRGSIPPGLRDLFAKTGTLHILAISGLHVGIIYFALRVILKILRVKKNFSVILSVLFLICYAIFAGARPSILRAATMFSILAFGEVFKRKIGIFNLIGLSCLIILMINPNQVFDLGFILSYVAVLSIIIISPAFYRLFSAGDMLRPTRAIGKKIKYYVLRSISVSMAAWVGLLPLLAYYFGLISPVIVIANLVVIPLLFMIMGSSLLFVSLGLASKFLALRLSQSTWFFLFVLVKSVKALKDIPFSYFKIRPPDLFIIIVYYLILVTVINARKIRKLTFLFLT